ncbi:type II toxin-antitoxin system HigB family toxin [Microcoleus sp. MON1_C1]
MPASILANNSVVFNIKGNSYRLIVEIRYDKRCGLLLNATVTFFVNR